MADASTPENLGGGRVGWPLHDGQAPFVRVVLGQDGPSASGLFRCNLGTAFGPDRRSGVFGRWSWDGATLSAEVDPLGFFNLFVYSKGDEIALSPSIPQLIALGADSARDERALGVFARLGLFINDDTPFLYIRSLPAGGRLHWRAGKVTIAGGDFLPGVREISRDEAVDGFIELTRQSLRDISSAWPGDFTLPLSGGRDSRHIFLGLDHIGRRPRMCVTFQHRVQGLGSESQAARAICKSVGAAHSIIGGHRAPLTNVFRAAMLTSFCSDEHVQMMEMHDYLAGSPDAVLDGIGGDILTNPDGDAGEHYESAQRGDFKAIARKMFRGHEQVITRPGQASPLPDDEEIAEYVAGTISRYADAADPYQAFWFWHRTRREISFVSSAILAGGAAVFCPFLDPRFVEFGLSLPFSVTCDRQLHNDALARGYPRHAQVPFMEDFADAPGGGRTIMERLAHAAGGARTILSLNPRHPFREVSTFLSGSYPVWRRPGEVRQIHRLVLESLDASKARQLLRLEAAVRDSASAVLTVDLYRGDPDHAG